VRPMCDSFRQAEDSVDCPVETRTMSMYCVKPGPVMRGRGCARSDILIRYIVCGLNFINKFKFDLTPPITSADETFVGLLEISAPKAGNTPTSSYKALVHLDLSYFGCYI
jgi:hypothetical protein